MTWLDGHSLVQTVFTCLYMHNPFIIEDPCLKVNIQVKILIDHKAITKGSWKKLETDLMSLLKIEED